MTRLLEEFYFDRPQTLERVHVGQRLLPSQQDRLYAGKLRVGLVITTYGAPAFVELGLAARRRMYADLPTLVHDDASPERDVLNRLCDEYGATFQSNSSALGHEMGDLSGIIGGLHWGRSVGVDLIVKMSRRFVPVSDWLSGLRTLAETTQFPTFGRRCQDNHLAIRTECVALAVEPWSDPSILNEMTTFMLKNRTSLLVEQYVFSFVRRAYELNCEAARKWEGDNVIATPRPPFVDWMFLSEGRRRQSPNYLWHETATAEAYMGIAAALGMAFAPGAFSGFCSQTRK